MRASSAPSDCASALAANAAAAAIAATRMVETCRRAIAFPPTTWSAIESGRGPGSCLRAGGRYSGFTNFNVKRSDSPIARYLARSRSPSARSGGSVQTPSGMVVRVERIVVDRRAAGELEARVLGVLDDAPLGDIAVACARVLGRGIGPAMVDDAEHAARLQRVEHRLERELGEHSADRSRLGTSCARCGTSERDPRSRRARSRARRESRARDRDLVVNGRRARELRAEPLELAALIRKRRFEP